MMNKMLRFLFIGITICSQQLLAQNIPDASMLFNKMMKSMEETRTCTFNLRIEEVVNGKADQFYHAVKLQTSPFKAYVYCVKPNTGAEALYIEGENSNKVLINPNKFPYFNISLGANNMLIRKSHAFAMTQMGFTYIHPLLKEYIAHEGLAFYNRLSCSREIRFNNNDYYLLEINNPEFGYVKYKVKKDESVSDIAEKLLVNDRMIMVINKSIHNYDVLNEGEEILVPNSFAKKIEFYLDKKTLLPMVQIIYNEKGLYSRIEFSSFVLNPSIDPAEFSRYYPKYNF
jgi:hypothetical protein